MKVLLSVLASFVLVPAAATCRGSVTDDGVDSVSGDASWWWGDAGEVVGDASESWDGWSAASDPDAALACQTTCSGTCFLSVCVATVAQSSGIATSIAADDSYVYWTDRGAWAVMRAPVAGGAASTFASNQQVADHVAVTDAGVYWSVTGTVPSGANGSVVMRAPKAGGTPQQVATWTNLFYKFITDGTAVYGFANFGASSVLVRVDLQGATTTTLAAEGQEMGDLAADSTDVYYTTVGSYTLFGTPDPDAGPGGGPLPVYAHNGTVNRVPKAGGSVTAIARSLNIPRQLAVAAGIVSYAWAGPTSSPAPIVGAIGSVAADGSSPPFSLISAADSLTAMTSDNGYVYWTSADGVSKMAPSGGAISRLGYVDDAGVALAVGASRVFWIDNGTTGCAAGVKSCSKVYSAPK